MTTARKLVRSNIDFKENDSKAQNFLDLAIRANDQDLV